MCDVTCEHIPECQQCGLYKYSSCPCIIGKGTLNKKTNLFLIGEAPGPDESKRGEVFIGRAGKMLDKMIKPFTKDLTIYITNSVKCYPPVSTRFPEKGFRVPKISEIELCRRFLLEELSLAPNVVLLMPLGNTALTTILLDKHEGITKAIGKFRQVTMGNGITYTVLPNYHPSYVLRNNNHRPEFERVMGLAVKYIHGELNCLTNSQENNKQ